MTGRQYERGRQLPMSERNSGRGCGSQSRGDAGNNLAFDVGSPQGFKFFAGTAKDQRIAALQSHHLLSRGCQRYQEKIDLFLPHGLDPASLADVLNPSRTRNQLQYLGRYEVIVKNDIGVA